MPRVYLPIDLSFSDCDVADDRGDPCGGDRGWVGGHPKPFNRDRGRVGDQLDSFGGNLGGDGAQIKSFGGGCGWVGDILEIFSEDRVWVGDILKLFAGEIDDCLYLISSSNLSSKHLITFWIL